MLLFNQSFPKIQKLTGSFFGSERIEVFKTKPKDPKIANNRTAKMNPFIFSEDLNNYFPCSLRRLTCIEDFNEQLDAVSILTPV